MADQGGTSKETFFERFFFVKSTFARLLLVILLVGGWFAANNMVKESQPDLEIAAATVLTAWDGGDAQTIEQEITNKLEKELKSLKGLKRMLSGSFSGYSIITVEFHPNVTPRDALARLRAKVGEAEGLLPKGVKKPSVNQASIDDSPIFSVRFYGDQDLQTLSALAKKLKQRFERVPGVNEASVSGDRKEIVMVRLLGARLSALGISPTQVQNAVQTANLDMPWGTFDGEQIGGNFRFLGRYRDLEQLRNLPIRRMDNGRVVKLSEVSVIERTLEQERTRTYFSADGKDFRRTVEISVTKRSGADAIDIIKSLKELLEKARGAALWPKGVEYKIVVDQSTDILRDLGSVFTNGWQAMLAVFLILLVSLTWREALVAGAAIPVAFAGGLILVAAFGYSLNQIVIIGMVVALGLLVDVFILMMEGMHEGMFVKGKNFRDAALSTVKSYALPALSGQLTTILAMAPLLGIAGIVGKYIRPMPMSTIACLIAAYVVALLIAIPLSRYVLPKKGGKVKETTVDKLSKKASDWLARVLDLYFLVGRWRALIWTGVAVLVFGLSMVVFMTLPSQLMPKGDGRNLGVLVEMEPSNSLKSAQRCADAVGERLRGLPYFENVTKYTGEKSPFSTTSLADQLSSSTGLNYVGFTAIFKPLSEREKLAYEYEDEITRHIRPAMDACPGGKLQLSMPTGGASAEAPIQIELVGDDMDTLRTIAEKLIAKLSETKGVRNARHNLGLPVLDIQAKPRMEALNFYGIDTQDFASQVRLMMSNDEVSKFVVGGIEEDIEIRMGYAWPSRDGKIGGPTIQPETQLLNVINSQGKSVSLFSLASFELAEASLTILHKDGRRTLTVLADTGDRTAGEILADIAPYLEKQKVSWPSDYSYNFAGEASDSQEVFGSSGVMLQLALFLVFALLVIQFDSFSQPLIIMAAIPLALTGSFFAFFAFQLPFSFMAMVGVIALIGIVVNDTIVMIDTMNRYRSDGKSVQFAAAYGAADRLRPILTTSITTIVGMIPLALSQKMWLPLGLTVIGGLIFSTVLALFIVPCLYMLFTKHGTVQEAD